MTEQSETPRATAAAVPHPAPDAPGPTTDDDALEEEFLRAARVLLRPNAYARIVDRIDDETLRTVLQFWGRVRGFYPASAARPARKDEPLRSYEVQPVGIPGPAAVTLSGDDVQDVMIALLDAMHAWERPDGALEEDAAFIRLFGLIEALRVMIPAVRTAAGPLLQAHDADERAARAWKRDRWFARSRLARDRPDGEAHTAAATHPVEDQTTPPATAATTIAEGA